MTGRNRLTSNRCFAGLVCALLFLTQVVSSKACPFCPGPSTPLTEKLSQSEIALLVEWVSAEEGTLKKPGKTIFEIKEIVHQTEKSKLKVGGQVTFKRYRSGKEGTLFLLLGRKETNFIWDRPIEMSTACFHYMVNAPALKETTPRRLRYFLKFLEHPDQKVATDAFAEFANAPFDDIALLADELPREKIRSWLVSSKTPVPRLGLYGLLLGLCGEASDIAFMEKKITEPAKQIRMGIGGLISGYLMLTGAEGLDVIDQSKFLARDVEFSETFSAMQALSFMWTDKRERISKKRMRKSMRYLLDRPVLADMVVANLARWEGWTVIDRLMQIYEDDDYDKRAIKRAIVRYLLVASKVKNQTESGSDSPTAEKAKQYLAKLRQEDPETVKSAQLLFFIK